MATTPTCVIKLLSPFLLFTITIMHVEGASNMYKKCSYSRGECHKALPSHAYINGLIYTVDTSDPNWHRYENIYFLLYQDWKSRANTFPIREIHFSLSRTRRLIKQD
jgi:hypothetical protein